MRRARRWLFGIVIAAAAVACGLDITGVAPVITSDAGVDASRRDVAPEPLPIDASPDVVEAGPAADAGCDAGGAFCSKCDRGLLLCVQFEGGIRDESVYAREIAVDGGPLVFVVEDGGAGAISLDGSVQVRVPSGSQPLEDTPFSSEFVVKLRSLPAADGSRYGLYDRNDGRSFFLYAGDGGAGVPHLRCRGVDTGRLDFVTDRFMHVACTLEPSTGRVAIYLDGERVAVSDAGAGFAATNDPVFLFTNDPSGDAFQGEIASVRFYGRKRVSKEIARAAGRDASDAADDP